MITDLLVAARRLRTHWPTTLFTWTVAASGVAVFLALAAVVDGLLLKPPFRGAEQIVVVRPPRAPERSNGRGVALEEFPFVAERTGLPVAAMGWPLPLGRSPAAPLRAWVSTNFFDLIGVRASLGRTFVQADHGLADRAVISDRLWRARFGADPDIADRSVVLGTTQLTLVGVLPRGFRVPDGTDVWIPHPDSYRYRALVHLPPGASVDAMRRRLAGWEVTSLPEHLAPDDASHAMVLLGAGGLLLLGTWIYMGLLQASETARRSGDTHLRVALGAGRWRAVRATLMEGYVSVGACVALGAIAAPAVLTWLMQRLPPELLAGRPIVFDVRAAVIVLGVLATGSALVTVVALPSFLRALRGGLADARPDARTGRHAARATRWIVAIQFAAAAPILYVLVLTAASFHALLWTDVGYRVDNVASAQVPPRYEVFDDEEGFSFESAARYVNRLQQLLDRTSVLPGVRTAAVSSDRVGFRPTAGSTRVRRRDAGEDGFVVVEKALVGGRYFELFEMPVIAGRVFSERLKPAIDWSEGFGEVVVDEELAEALGGAREIVGRSVIVDFTPATVVGVVGTIRSRRPDDPPRPRIYLNVSPANSSATNLLVRFTGEPAPLRRAVALVVREEFGTPGPADTVLLTEELARLQAPYRGRYELLALMGWIAAVLTAAGVFGVASYAVARRRRELAIRMAVGAPRTRILWVCLRDLLVASAAGTFIGLVVGVLLGRQAADLLFGVTPMDSRVLTSIAGLLVVIAIAGVALPIRDAWRTDVSVVLRQE